VTAIPGGNAEILEDLKPMFMDLADSTTAAVESMVLAIRAYSAN